MNWNHDIFLKNIQILVDKHCNGNQAEFGRRIHDRQAVTKWKSGSKPDRDKLLSIEDEFHCGLNWLIYDETQNSNVRYVKESCPVQCDEEMMKLCGMVKNVVRSKTEYSGALNENIHAFDLAVEERKKSEKERTIMQGEINNLRSTVFDVLKKLEHMEKQKDLKPSTDTD
jgi:hypothetical protein